MVDRGTILAKLAMRVGHAPADTPFVERMCHACLDILAVEGVALTVGYTSDQRVTLCSTGPTAARLEDLQEVLGEGPGWDASREGGPCRRTAALRDGSLADAQRGGAPAARHHRGAVAPAEHEC
ncbi:hypothetical protein [Ornithinimicrobium cavernae]|uniref:hypothetical protein n=1 Tax=Ornithinimicrobium cavernae TaxID=2666047 RepID=UPI0012B16708|nr:hypothetical protein [Ornithinimicrobium cavernae]